MLSMSVCVPDVLVCLDKYIRHAHIHRQQYSHIPNKRRKQVEKVVTALSTKDDPLKIVKQL